jgi:UDPglucose 6-dehydrogenase
LDQCIGALAPLLSRPALVVGKCTVPVGTAARISRRLSLLAPRTELAWCPEFLREGHAVTDTLRPDRIVAGVQSDRAAAILRDIHAGPIAAGAAFLVTDLNTAELVKVAANAFLATKISFINAMAEVCEAAHGDVQLLAEALGHDPRIGPAGLRPGLGFGGGCLPKDIRAFMARAEELGVDQALSFLREVDAINMRRRARMVDLARELADGDLDGATVGVLGVAFKPDSDDVRDSPALDVARTIASLGARVTVYDPVAMPQARRVHPELGYAPSAVEAVRDADVVLLLTEWAEFRDANPELLGSVVARRNIVDGRNTLDPARWRAARWHYRALGRPLAADRDVEAVVALEPRGFRCARCSRRSDREVTSSRWWRWRRGCGSLVTRPACACHLTCVTGSRASASRSRRWASGSAGPAWWTGRPGSCGHRRSSCASW